MLSIETNNVPQFDLTQNVTSDKRVLARQVAYELPVDLGNSAKFESSDRYHHD